MKREKDPLSLPDGYAPIREINLKKLRIFISIVSLLIVFAMYLFPVSFWKLFSNVTLPIYGSLTVMIFIVSGFLCILLRDLIRGLLSKHYCGSMPPFGFTILHSLNGRPSGYFLKRHYQIILFAPTVLLISLLLLLMVIFPPQWFFLIFLLLTLNIFVCLFNDLYISCRLLRTPADTLCNDDGLSMRFYARG